MILGLFFCLNLASIGHIIQRHVRLPDETGMNGKANSNSQTNIQQLADLYRVT